MFNFYFWNFLKKMFLKKHILKFNLDVKIIK